jgi:NADH-quinone oxidoreductase subunit J
MECWSIGNRGRVFLSPNTPFSTTPLNLMPSFLFWLFAIVMLVFGAAVVINRNPIASALSLVVCFIGLSALFMSLDAFFIGIIQVLVYAGAVMVLFLFIIMLLDLRAEERRKLNWIAFGGGLLVAFSLLVQILAVIGSTRMAKQTFPPLASPQTDDVRSVGLVLFGNYNLPFQVIAVLILVATIGVIVLSKRQLR